MQDLLAGESLFIVDEDLEINIYGKDHVSTAYRFFKITRKVTYRILNSEGVQRLSKIKLPEDFDPTMIYHASNVKNLGDYYSAYKVGEFKVRVSRDGVKPFNPKVKRKVNVVESFNIDYLYDFYQHEYNINGLEVGDEVYIVYELTIPFQENYSRFSSYRIFHHGSIPKKSYKLNITHHEMLDIEFYEKNGEYSRVMERENNLVSRQWKFSNLPGCMDESNARPYMELPHVNWVINHYKYYAHNSNEQKNLPHYAIVSSLRSDDLPSILVSVEVGSNSRQFAPFSQAYDEMTQGIPSDFNVLKKLHTDIVDDFKYSPSKDYYRREDMRGERIGEFFENKMLRDVSRYNVYYAIMVKNDMQFFTTYTIDKRVGQISREFFAPTFDNDYLLSVYFGERLFDIILPKRSRMGWYYNEIPFYWEDCTARLVHISDYASYRYPVKDVFRSIQIQKNAPTDNNRTYDMRMNVSFEKDSIDLSGSLLLQGQFSTSCRFAYQKGYRDPSIDQDYHLLINERMTGASDLKISQSGISRDYPFTATFDLNFQKKKNGYAPYVIDMTNFFPHIRSDIHASVRYLDYYPDFLGKDVIQYKIVFDQEYWLKNPQSYGFSNELGYYKFTSRQLNPKEVMVTSELHVNTERLEKIDIKAAREIYQAIERANRTVLEFR